MKHIITFIALVIKSRWLRVCFGLVIFGTLTIADSQSSDLSSSTTEWNNSVKPSMNDISKRVNDYLEKSKKLREMDKTELDALITQICKLDIARSDDEADRLAKSMRDKVVESVRREYDNLNSEADRIEDDAEKVLANAKSLRDNTKNMSSYPEVKNDADKLLSEISNAVDSFTNNVYNKLTTDYRTLTNIKEGVMNGSNNPKIRAAMDYGKEKHIYNQRICEEKELSLNSGRPDCVSFQKDNCAVWEFKPDSAFSESDAASWASKYVSDVQERFKDDTRAKENCKKDSNGRPIFEAKGSVYPACRP